MFTASSVEKYLRAGRDAGCPPDQMERFVHGGYVAFPEMLPFHAAAREMDRDDGADSIALGGTRAPGKSHATLCQVGLDDCQRFLGLKWLFLRYIMKSAVESFEDLAYKVFANVPHNFTPSTGRVEFANGSRILIGGYRNESDIDKYLGIEYDGIVIEEATQVSADKVSKILGSVRSVARGWKARMYLSTNADGIGLTWFKNKYLYPYRAGPTAEHENRTRFFQCWYQNNPLLKPEYIRYLEGLTGALGKAWRESDWDAFEGMAFPNWNESLHVVDPFPVPNEWFKWRATDDGYAKPWCTGWLTRDPNTRRIYVYREAYQTQLTSSAQAQLVRDMTPPNETIALHYADPSMWAKKNAVGKVSTPVDDYAAKGIILTPGDNTRIIGKRKLDELLSIRDDGLPGLQIFRTCPNIIRTLPTLAYDKTYTEDVDTDMEDHGYDMLRYGLTNIQSMKIPKKIEATQSPLQRIRIL